MSELFATLGVEEIVEDMKALDNVDTDGTGTVEAELLEVNEEQKELTKDQVEASDLQDDINSLEEVAVAMEAAGLDAMNPTAMNFAKIAVARVNRRWKIPSTPIASMEAFTADPVEGYRTSLEGIKEAIGNFWKALMAKIQKMWKSFRSWLVKVFDVCPKIKERAILLKRRSVDVKFPSSVVIPEKVKFDDKLLFEGKMPTPDGAAQVLKTVQAYVSHALDARAGEESKKMMQELTYTIKWLTSNENVKGSLAFEKTINNALTSFTTYMKDYAMLLSGGHMEPDPSRKNIFQKQKEQKGQMKALGEMFKAHRSRELPGGKAIVTAYSFGALVGAAGSLETLAGIWYLDLDDYEYGKKKDPNRKIVAQALNGKQIASLCDMITGICDTISEYKHGWDKREGIQKEAMAEVSKYFNSVKDDIDPHQRMYVRSAAGALAKIWGRLTRFDNQVIRYGIDICRSTLHWCQASLSLYIESLDAPKQGDNDYRSASKDITIPA